MVHSFLDALTRVMMLMDNVHRLLTDFAFYNPIAFAIN